MEISDFVVNKPSSGASANISAEKCATASMISILQEFTEYGTLLIRAGTYSTNNPAVLKSVHGLVPEPLIQMEMVEVLVSSLVRF